MGYFQTFFDLRKFVSNCYIKQKQIAKNYNMKLLNHFLNQNKTIRKGLNHK
ncbi:unnamed protein product [Paramecium sonneborni]|uniref:Uncharacterized protein n=1 Tax=Paramecium sonneborni TaxID=65129 RepID=A0A8S1QPT1_9CILI|nr:unnamed protein product [Paramecium sonneborni]